MYILVNEQSINITKHKVVRNTMDGRLNLTVWIPKENIIAGDLDALCTIIEETAPTIRVCENEEVVQTLTGFKLYPVFALSKDRISWELNIENSSELEYQYGLLKQRADDLEKTNASQARLIESQGEQIVMQTEVINNQGALIVDQGQRLNDQANLISEQTQKIESQDQIIANLELNNRELNETVNALLGMEA